MVLRHRALLEVKEAEVDRLAPLVYGMCGGIMPVEFPVELQIGRSWGEMEEYK
jgi:hypothetical protein